MKVPLPLVIGALVGAAPASAWACGGLFCAAPPPVPAPPEPVDQTAERIIFEVHEDVGKVTAHVQIAYTGSADDFAWVVPVASVPEVAESSIALIQRLDEATRMQVSLPASEPCAIPVADDGGGGFGCGDADFDNNKSGGASPSPAEGDTVTVYASDYTANYEYVVVGAESTQQLVTWLQDNGYNVSDNMTPVMDVYNALQGKFLAVKLRDGRSASDVVPLRFTYDSELPMIPLQLTRVAAQPSMGILVLIVADEPYQPRNFQDLWPEPLELLFDDTGRTSYFEWVARAVDERSGRAMITETIERNPLKDMPIENYQLRGQVVTRLYTRMSPEHMSADPVFEPRRIQIPAGGRLDLSRNPTLWACGGVLIEERRPSECAFNYCGGDAECTVIDGRVGCLCAPGDVATTVTGPDGSDHVTCTPRDNPIGITAGAGGEGTAFDPCNDVDCGEGTCVLKSGFPTCECDPGKVACLEPGRRIQCVDVPVTAETFGPGAGLESRGAVASLMPTRGDVLYSSSLWMAFAGLIAWQQRRRR